MILNNFVMTTLLYKMVPGLSKYAPVISGICLELYLH